VNIEASTPVVDPLSTKFGLLFEANDFGNVFTLVSGGLERSKNGASGGTSTDDSDSLFLDWF